MFLLLRILFTWRKHFYWNIIYCVWVCNLSIKTKFQKENTSMHPKFRSRSRTLPATQKLPSGFSIIRHTSKKATTLLPPISIFNGLKFFTLHSLKILFYEVNNKTKHLSCLFAHFLLNSWSPYIFWIVFPLWLRW